MNEPGGFIAFLGDAYSGKSDPFCLFHQLKGSRPKDANICSFVLKMSGLRIPVWFINMLFATDSWSKCERSKLIPKLLQHLHELLVHVIKTTTASARHFGLAELGVIMSSMAIPLTAFNCQRNISGPLQILPSLSNLAFISETKWSSSELVD